MRRWSMGVVLAALALAACGVTGTVPSPPGAGLPGAPAETDDWCPDPEHERVHYQSRDARACADLELGCSTGQNGFRSSCGCGCIDKGDPICPVLTETTIDWLGISPEECDPQPPACALDQFGFSNACGCGCVSPGAS